MNHRGLLGERTHLIFRIVVAAALLAAFAQVTLGGVVRVTGSGLGCPDWPLCHGRLVPPFELTTLIEYSHRLSAAFLGVLTLAAAALAWLYYRSNRWIMVSAVLALALVAAAAIMGGVTVLTDLDRWNVLVHLGIAEALVACLVVTCVSGWSNGGRSLGVPSPTNAPRVDAKIRFNALIIATMVAVFVLILSGSFMVGYGAGSACPTWPLCSGEVLPSGNAYAMHMGHRFVAAAAGMLILATAAAAWSRRDDSPALGWAGLALAVVFAAQVTAGAGTVYMGFTTQMKALHLSLATLVWGFTVFLATLTYPLRQMELRGVGVNPAQISKLEGSTP